MMEVLSNYGLFLAKSITIVLAVLFVISFITRLAEKGRQVTKDHITVKHLNRKFREYGNTIQSSMLDKRELKKIMSAQKKARKAEKKTRSSEKDRRRVFVLNFKGDINASAIKALREEITALLSVSNGNEEVVLRLESSGGVVHSHGLAASQLQRLKDKKIPLTVAVDKIAASGGYLIGCVADRLVAAPFAIIGSIGVVASLPNFHRLLKKNDVDYEQITAGEYKRTLSLFGKNTEKGRKKFAEQLEETHTLFKEFVGTHRRQVDIDSTATGEYWYGTRAKELKLVDDLITSDDLLLQKSETADLYELEYQTRKSFSQRISEMISITANKTLFSLWETAGEGRYL